MKYFIDLDDTLVNSTILNNDAYNFALEMFGYGRILTNERITMAGQNYYKELDGINDAQFKVPLTRLCYKSRRQKMCVS